MPVDVGGYEASDDIIAETLAEIARGCPSRGSHRYQHRTGDRKTLEYNRTKVVYCLTGQI